jgi:6-methylsalicylate decarboxylase
MIDARLPQLSRAQVYERLRHFWYDTALSPTEQTLDCLDAVAAPERIVFGSDWPFANAGVVAEAGTTYAAVPLPADRRDAIDRRNALSLFPQFA